MRIEELTRGVHKNLIHILRGINLTSIDVNHHECELSKGKELEVRINVVVGNKVMQFGYNEIFAGENMITEFDPDRISIRIKNEIINHLRTA